MKSIYIGIYILESLKEDDGGKSVHDPYPDEIGNQPAFIPASETELPLAEDTLTFEDEGELNPINP